MENYSNRNQIKNTQNFRLLIIDFFISFLLFLPFGVAFALLTANEFYYFPCSKESSSYWWSRFSLIFFIIGCILLGFVSPFLVYFSQKLQERKKFQRNFLDNIALIIRIALGIVFFVNFGGICYAYSENEDCGILSHLLLGFIIVYSIILGILFLYLCIFSILGQCFLCDIFVEVRNRLNRPLIN